jgi:hypothetical protein
VGSVLKVPKVPQVPRAPEGSEDLMDLPVRWALAVIPEIRVPKGIRVLRVIKVKKEIQDQ